MVIFLGILLHFIFLSAFSELMNTLNFALQCRIQIEKPNAIHKQIDPNCFRSKYLKMELITKENQTADHFDPWKPGISIEQQSNAD